MSLFIVGAALLITTSATAQSRWTLSAGPEFTSWAPGKQFWGMRFRAEFDITRPSSFFGLRLEGGARWGPTQSGFYESGPRSIGGTDQRADLMFGLSSSISPFPRGRVSPYVTVGVFARQFWRRGSFFVRDSTGLSYDVPNLSYTSGDFVGAWGVGLRARLFGRSFQLELRDVRVDRGVTFGTRLPF